MEGEATPIRVLVVDDDELFRRLIHRVLTKSVGPPMACTAVETLQEALAHLEREGADVVLLDGTLPNSPGLSAIGQVLERAPGIAIVIFTGYPSEELEREAIGAGARDYVVKGEASVRALPGLLLRALRGARGPGGAAPRSEPG